MKWIGLALIGILTASMHGQSADAVAAAKSACGPGDPKFSVTTEPAKDVGASDQGDAQLYILEVQDHVGFCPFGCGQTVKLGLDGRWVGATKGNSFLVLPVESGEHHICAEWDAHGWFLHKKVELAGFSAEKGKSYYFRAHVTPGTTETISEFHLEPVDADEGKLLVATRQRAYGRTK